MLPYESLLSHASNNKKIKEKKIEKKINIDLAVLPSHDRLILSIMKKASAEPRTKALIVVVSEILAV